MAPLVKALEVRFESMHDGDFIYGCELDGSWGVAGTPQGGYSLGMIVEACVQHQSAFDHMDPIHVTAHFLHITKLGRGEVHVRVMKVGHTFTHLLANLVQQDCTKIAAHLIFGDLTPPSPEERRELWSPRSPYERRLPLSLHPSITTPWVAEPAWAFQQPVRFSLDDEVLSRNKPENITKTATTGVGGGGVEWAAWCELTSEGDKIKVSALPFFADSFVNIPGLLPASEPSHDARHISWYPTITMTLEFKARIPSSREQSDSTVGIYCETRFLSEPHTRHDTRVEVWSAPSRIGEGEPVEGWRENQYCIAVGNQMSIKTPLELNLRGRKRDIAKL